MKVTDLALHCALRAPHAAFLPRSLKAGAFVLEGLNALATTWYFFYIYFFMQERFGFGKLHNLLLAALLGLIYTFAAMFGGRFAQRHGCFTALKIGFLGLAAALAAGSWMETLAAHLAVVILGTVAMCFTWPTLQALVCEGEPPARLQKMVGIYNLVWATAGAFAYFTGGALIETWGLPAMFLVPASIHVVQLMLTLWLERKAPLAPPASPGISLAAPPAGPPRSLAHQRAFLKMAWLANPFTYLAVNTLIAVTPNLAQQLHLSPMFAGFLCSVWLFVRAGSFLLLWLWPGWHYRFRWLAGAYVAMVVSFAFVLLASNLAVLLAAQVVFGISIGLIYYSSLFYSMDVGETKGEHGGLHEAAIGAGSCAGPAIGAAALHYFPNAPGSSVWAVSGLLVCGLLGLFWMRRGQGRRGGVVA